MLMLLLFLLAITSSASVLWVASVSFVLAVVAAPMVAGLMAALFSWRLQPALEERTLGSQVTNAAEAEAPRGFWAQYARALPNLTTELRGSAVQLEHAVTQVCRSLRDIEGQAAANVAGTVKVLKAADADHVERECHIEALVRNSRRTLGDCVERIIQSSGRALKAVYELEDVKLAMSRVSQVTDDIEDSARRSVGGGVAEIAACTSSSIRELLRRIDARLIYIHDELRQIASTDFGAILKTHEQFEKAVAALASENQELRIAAECTAEQEQTLCSNIAHAARALGAEAAARKKLGYLEQALMVVEKDMHQFIAGWALDEDRADGDQWKTGLEEKKNCGVTQRAPEQSKRVDLF
jgi:hypothetical protein